MPVFTAYKYHTFSEQHGVTVSHFVDFGDNMAFGIFSLSIESVEFICESEGFVIVLGEKEFKCGSGRAESSRSVYSWCKGKADSFGIYDFVAYTAYFFQCDECGAVCIVYAFHSVGNYIPVLPCHADDIRNSSDCGKVAELFENHCIVSSVHSGSEFQGDNSTAGVFER